LQEKKHLASVGLAMIVKNEASTLRNCLESVRGLVAQVVIADTGSTDTTAEIARGLGATVLPVPWANHFALARNAVLEAMTTDWILVLDADEELDLESRRAVPLLLETSKADAYSVTIREYLPARDGYYLEWLLKLNDRRMARSKIAPYYCERSQVRLFRRHPEVGFSGRVHERLERHTSSSDLNFVPANLVIHHFGRLCGPEVLARKDQLCRELSYRRIGEETENPLAWYELGILEYTRFSSAASALSCLQRAAGLCPSLAQAWLHLGALALALNRPTEALELLKLLETGNWKLESRFAAICERLKGDAFEALGRLPEAQSAYQRFLDLGGPDPLAESKLGFTLVRLGEAQTGLAKLQHAVAEAPFEAEYHDRHMKAHVIAGDWGAAAEAAETFAAYISEPRLFLRAASIRLQLNQEGRAEKLLSLGLMLFPESQDLRTAYEQLEHQRIDSVANPLYSPNLGIPSRLLQTLQK
jgi:tetratricopeptide (TPR) repeat protein